MFFPDVVVATAIHYGTEAAAFAASAQIQFVQGEVYLDMSVSSNLELDHPPTRVNRKQGGMSCTDLLLSAHVGTNAQLFPKILDLHVPARATVADVTYGTGVFWRDVDITRYRLLATDITTGVDCRELPYGDNSIDALVLDPPYMEGLLRVNRNHLAGTGSHSAFRGTYSSDAQLNAGPKYHAAVVDLYVKAGAEAWRVLKPGGTCIVKCQDEVSANKQRLTHVEIINEYVRFGFHTKDLFVLIRSNRPGVSRIKRQVHARKNHSYFLVFTKPRKRGSLNEIK